MKSFCHWKEESSSHNINNNMLLIGMSANASAEDQNEAFEAGMHFFASKPVDVIVLSLLVENKRACLDLTIAIDVIRAAAMSSENKSDVYSSQICNLRSPPNDSDKSQIFHSQCVPAERSADMNQLKRCVRGSSNNQMIAVKLIKPTDLQSCTSSSHNPLRKKNVFYSNSVLYTMRRLLCGSCKIQTL